MARPLALTMMGLLLRLWRRFEPQARWRCDRWSLIGPPPQGHLRGRGRRPDRVLTASDKAKMKRPWPSSCPPTFIQGATGSPSSTQAATGSARRMSKLRTS